MLAVFIISWFNSFSSNLISSVFSSREVNCIEDFSDVYFILVFSQIFAYLVIKDAAFYFDILYCFGFVFLLIVSIIISCFSYFDIYLKLANSNFFFMRVFGRFIMLFFNDFKIAEFRTATSFGFFENISYILCSKTDSICPY